MRQRSETVAAALLGALLILLWICWYLLPGITAALGSLARFYTFDAPRSIAALAAIGCIAMALLQAFRLIVPIRGVFHRSAVRKWLGPQDDVLNHLLRIANVTDSGSFFDMPIEQVCGQLSAVAELALAQPARYRRILAALGGLPGAGAVEELEGSEDLEARSRLGYHIQRNIDNLQITVSTRWRRLLRLTAMAISAILAYTAAKPVPGHALEALLTALFVGLVSGFLATLFRDLVAIVERLRRA